MMKSQEHLKDCNIRKAQARPKPTLSKTPRRILSAGMIVCIATAACAPKPDELTEETKSRVNADCEYRVASGDTAGFQDCVAVRMNLLEQVRNQEDSANAQLVRNLLGSLAGAVIEVGANVGTVVLLEHLSRQSSSSETTEPIDLSILDY